MPIADYTRKLLALAATIHRWLAALLALDAAEREKVARYADEIAATLARAAEAFVELELEPGNRMAGLRATRELGRIAGYIETIVEVLDDHLDGRKLAGVKRRLDQLASRSLLEQPAARADVLRIDRLAEAEGYFRALADGLRM